ncbi:putative hydroxyacylglutathione hydrolase protein [Botrytis fragariae]|uniref:hydroxyacylglutathione hydrolase n=1 Tax=Botrytis fragariae TaxID=1964551 RepID=A0A8H6EPD5_9HELO|nr:putative hydroxyacylglutathione hydrolase protein [Botrytis fragariae]KAF5879554.1 putative hydroxyacylglutathione hydrolase protein [Botrytis fragariae]
MHIQSIPMWEGSSNNYAYLVVDEGSRDAVVIDPASAGEVAPVLKEQIKDGKINLVAIVNTHHHWDHAGGNNKMVTPLPPSPSKAIPANTIIQLADPEFKGKPVIGGKDCEGVTKTPKNGEGFTIGEINVKALYTPCHTQDSICWFMEDKSGKAIFTGDTLFHGGCGRFFEGTAEEMHTALNKTLAAVPDDTVVYPGHEYTKANVKFAVSVSQSEAVKALEAFADENKETQGKFTIGDEKKHNVFMRMDDPEIQKATGKTDPVEVMAKLREMKNNFKNEEMAQQPLSHGAPGEEVSGKDKILETGASITQDFAPVKKICAHLNAFHVYAGEPGRSVEANHYCTHLSGDVRQCLIYDSPTNPARLIGVEYMITRRLYEKLDEEERKLWHSHDYEVKSGMLILPNPTVPDAVWTVAETEEMKEVIELYGKTFHFWQTDRGDELPLGMPVLMGSFTADDQVPWDKVKERDERFGVDTQKKREARKGIESVDIHEDADQVWKKK